MFIDSGKVIYTWSNEPPVKKTREKLKNDAVKEEYSNLILPGWSITDEDCTKKS